MRHLPLLIAMVLCSISSATTLVETDPWCIDLPMSAAKKQLQCLKSSEPALLVRKILTEIIQAKRPSPPIYSGRYLTETEVIKLFKQPILIYEITYQKHAAYDVTFIFKDFPNHEFRAVIGFLENKRFHDLDALVDAGPEESTGMRKLLKKTAFSSFWLP